MSEDVLFAIHDWALGISPVTSYSGVKVTVVAYNMNVHNATCISAELAGVAAGAQAHR